MTLAFKHRISNFSAGPSTLPTSVLEKAKHELLNYQDSGMSIMEVSHRTKLFEDVLEHATNQIKKLMELSDDMEVLFMQGGARYQFAVTPLNFLDDQSSADIVHTGAWTKLAIQEISQFCSPRIVASSEDRNFSYLPKIDLSNFDPNAKYVHYCSNNTIYGTQWKNFQFLKNIPVVVDMSSDILSRKLDFNQFDLIYAGAQKNLGPSGITLVVIKKEFADKGRSDIPKYFQYRSHIENQSMFNTPPTFAIYLLGLVTDWIQEQGGLESIEKRNTEKSNLLYNFIDKSSLYTNSISNEDRSQMNVVFRLDSGNEDLEQDFVKQAHQNELFGLKGHRSAGGIRASIYNAQSLEAVKNLVSFMSEFERTH